jgi:hypothetical protein
MLADDIADRIAIACPGELDGIIKDMWVCHQRREFHLKPPV